MSIFSNLQDRAQGFGTRTRRSLGGVGEAAGGAASAVGKAAPVIAGIAGGPLAGLAVWGGKKLTENIAGKKKSSTFDQEANERMFHDQYAEG